MSGRAAQGGGVLSDSTVSESCTSFTSSTSFTHDHAGERLSGVYGDSGGPGAATAVLLHGAGTELRISGVADWVETSWGPADLDVAHCSTALALLHGSEHGLGFRGRYEAHGGRRLAAGPDHLYWRLLDALAYSPDAAKLAGPWRELGRTELTPEVLGARLEAYAAGLLERFA